MVDYGTRTVILFFFYQALWFSGVIPPLDGLMQVGVQFGFNALLVVLLLYYSRQDRKEEREERAKDRKAISLLTKSVTEQTLAMTFLPPQFHKSAHEVHTQLAKDEDV